MNKKDIKCPNIKHHRVLRQQFLEKFIQNVVFDGCSEKNFNHTVCDLNIELDQHMLLFPRKHIDVVDFWLTNLDDKLLDELAKIDHSSMKIREKIALAVGKRIEILQPQKQEFIQLYSHLALPLNKIKLLKSTFKTSSHMWYWAGDKSTDWNYYSKRSLLSYVYTSSLLFWFQNKDKSLQEVNDFITRRINEVMLIPQIKSKISSKFENIFSMFSEIKTMKK